MSPIHRETIEWCDLWLTAAEATPRRPRVLFIGDSITRAYFPVADRLLGPAAACARCCTSRFLTDPVFFQELALILGQVRFAVIHVNNGLHGWAFSEADYAQGLPVLIQFLRDRQPQAALIWGQSTRVLHSIHLDPPRVEARNRLADAAMTSLGVTINPLYAATSERPELFSSDGVHYLPEGDAVLGAQAAALVRSRL